MRTEKYDEALLMYSKVRGASFYKFVDPEPYSKYGSRFLHGKKEGKRLTD